MKRRIRCSFCGKGRNQVNDLIAGPKTEEVTVYICSGCVDASYEVLHEESISESIGDEGHLYSPAEINEFLDRYIIGQKDAKRIISVAAYNHYMRINDIEDDGVVLDKSNVLLLGPSGVGKTLLVRTVAEFLDIPYVIADATTLTEAGYTGADVENLLHLLVQKADGDFERASKGIIFIDEVDKITKKSNTGMSGRDISGEGVQQALLKLIEGTEIKISCSQDYNSMEMLDTSNILFMVSGAFLGLEEIIRKTMNKSSIGINSDIKNDFQDTAVLREMRPEDLINYGLIPEFVGRFPIYAIMDTLTKSELLQILTDPTNNLVAQYKKMFRYEKVDLKFTPGFLLEVVEKAAGQKTGARGLRHVLEKVMHPLQYDLPERARDGIKKVVVGEKGEVSYIKRRQRKRALKK